ncbi:MAG: hypothetical protein CL933_04790 [Deltaproteobacteria bacterium]|nr:hypothetical protein [Deltaproteobacteria bacterium]
MGFLLGVRGQDRMLLLPVFGQLEPGRDSDDRVFLRDGGRGRRDRVGPRCRSALGAITAQQQNADDYDDEEQPRGIGPAACERIFPELGAFNLAITDRTDSR